MNIYYGLFGRRRLRPYAGIWFPIFGGAFGVGRRGPWIKFSGRQMFRQIMREGRR